ncbi:PREDICTED: chorismate mutase 2-like [Lupinus angustifolius]|uniref:chorismate mutase 2-like n=1 Tax=Lupinus angustifolius TaxID=3871 RepID=UPI00092E33B0|nr:PREDICTED: chorismate mutase 2-like [Lupinus angustifolius]
MMVYQFGWVLVLIICSIVRCRMAEGNYTLDSVRDVLVREEDIIIFGLIERAKFPLNFNAYNKNYFNIPSFALTLLHFVAIDTEALQAKGGRYGNPEENPFFPEKLPPSFVTPYPFTKFLHAGGASININKSIWKFYLDEFLSKWFDVLGDDGNYAQTAASDFSLLQAISRRIHYGKFVAEVKFRDSPKKYEPLICAKDKKGIEKLLTDTSVEEKVIKRVEEKARVYGMYVTLNKGNKNGTKYKVDPLVVSTLYKKWLIPLTKSVEVEYLLHRLD